VTGSDNNDVAAVSRWGGGVESDPKRGPDDAKQRPNLAAVHEIIYGGVDSFVTPTR